MRPLYVLMLAALVTSSFAQSSEAPSKSPDPPDVRGWFVRADDLTNLRLPGSPPFHLKATFHAAPGLDFARTGKSSIVTGDGIYEEFWVSPEVWRREVTLGSYHTVEVRNSGGVRKLQASSDYEPTRVLMFLDALYNPVPRNLISPELIDKHAGWKVEHLSAGHLQYVRISSATALNADTLLKHEYDFLPNGILIRNEESDSISSTWQDFLPFGGKLVAHKVMAGAMGHALMDASISIEPLVTPLSSLFSLPGEPAAPGETLRPLHSYDVHYGQLLHGTAFGVTGDAFEGTVSGVVDRTGVPRELEVVFAQSMAQADVFIRHFAENRFAPSTIDGSPCQVIMRWFTPRHRE